MRILKQAYTAEFKELAVKPVKDGQNEGAGYREPGLSKQTLHNWVVKVVAEAKLNSAGVGVDAAEEMELSGLSVENLRLKRENEILIKRRRTLQGMFCEVCPAGNPLGGRPDCRARPGIYVVRNA